VLEGARVFPEDRKIVSPCYLDVEVDFCMEDMNSSNGRPGPKRPCVGAKRGYEGGLSLTSRLSRIACRVMAPPKTLGPECHDVMGVKCKNHGPGFAFEIGSGRIVACAECTGLSSLGGTRENYTGNRTSSIRMR